MGQIEAMTTVTHDPDASRFTSGAAYLSYVRSEGELDVQHTIVPAELSGRGIGSALVAAAVAYAQEEGLEVRPTCWFARDWLEKNPAA